MAELKRNTRRQFLKGAAVAGSGVAAAGMFAGVASAAQADIKWDEETDVLVVGTGIAGYGAAIEAFDAGAKVMIIEKEDWYGGNSLLSGGNCQFPVNHVQEKAGIEDTPELAYNDIQVMGEHRAVPELVNLFIDNSAETALWFENLGIVWRDEPSKQDGCSVARTLVPAPSDNYPHSKGISLIAVLHKAAEEREIPIKLSHKMTKIIRPDMQGPVLGLEVKTGDKTINIKANKAVVLASGGFKANHQMIKAYHPQLDEEWSWSGAPYVHTTGDGHLLAQAVGAGLTDMSFVLEFSWRLGTNRYVVWEPPAMETNPVSGGLPFSTSNKQYMILVENDGKRYANEDKFATGHVTLMNEHTIAYLNLPKRPRMAWMVVDSVGAEALTWKAEDFAAADLEKGPFLDPKMVATADTLEELAEQMGVPAANLAETVKTYNEYAAAGEDKDFGRAAPMEQIAQGPFFAVRLGLVCHDQCAGIRVNSKLQVIEQMAQFEAGSGPAVALDEEKVIPHLYAVGETAGGTFGADRGSGKMGSYLVQGRIGGKIAAAEESLA